jgi:glutaredoxin
MPVTSLRYTVIQDLMESTKAAPAEKPRVIIYSRPGCHLCEEAKQAIQMSGCPDEYTLDEINIESNSELLRRYRDHIPVITINGVEAFRHRLTSDEFKKRLKEEARVAALPDLETPGFAM